MSVRRVIAKVSLVFLVLSVSCLVLWCIAPISSHVRLDATRAVCKANLREIGLALSNYRDAHGTYPPPYLTDDKGRPMHSWRVLLMPYLEDFPFWEEYNINEPWNSPHNKKLLETTQMPRVFRCPRNFDEAESRDTDYVMIVGANAARDEACADRRGQCGDYSDSRIIIVEVRHSGIPWTAPRDLDISSSSCRVGSSEGLAPRSNHGDPYVLFDDGRIKPLEEKTSPEEFTAMARGVSTKNNGANERVGVKGPGKATVKAGRE